MKTLRLPFGALLLAGTLVARPALAQSETPAAAPAEAPAPEAAAMPMAEAPSEAPEAAPVMRTKIYGYLDALVEKEYNAPVGVEDGETVHETSPHEFDIPNLNLMTQVSYSRFKAFINLKASGGDAVEVRNAWVEGSLVGDILAVRAGRMYRPFGLYNEILDAVPTYIGIEPPELFDKDHLLLTRTTNLMLHGRLGSGAHAIGYAFTTGNDEKVADEVPLGADLNYTWNDTVKIGSSLYSTMGDAAPTVGVGEGVPQGGVLPWLAKDEYMVYGAYLQINWDALLFQAEFWEAAHDAERDPASVVALADTGLTERQYRRFGLDPANPQEDDVVTDIKFKVRTWYTRIGYSIDTELLGEVIPYAQYDWYRNAEIIANKDFGGDDEAGISDDGEFYKITAGVVVRPVPQVAVKLDVSDHARNFNGKNEQNPEFRLNFSYLWSL